MTEKFQAVTEILNCQNPTFDSQDANLSEVASVTQDNKLCDSIISNHSQFSLLDDVHLATNVSFFADIVSWTVDLWLQFQHQLHQQASLTVRKDAHLPDGSKCKIFPFN